MKRKEDYPLFDKSYQLSVDIFKATMKFPKSQRYVISQRLQDASIKLIEEITLGFTSTDKLSALYRASDYLERLRILTRVTYELNFWSFSYYERINVQINEIGKMLGGWIKKEKG
ncbi:MAG: diversity-generating retroelement protein Avd [bacterium]|nr:diversity-generating retroelement protein Avd [bacterium]